MLFIKMKKNNKRYTRKKTTKELIQIREDYLNVVNPLHNKVNKVLRVVGVGCLVVAIIPNGLGVIFYPIAFSLLGISMIDIKRGVFMIKYKIRYGVYIRELKYRLLLWRSK